MVLGPGALVAEDAAEDCDDVDDWDAEWEQAATRPIATIAAIFRIVAEF